MSREDGRRGEDAARRWLKARGDELFQVDWMVRTPLGEWFIIEVKHQFRFLGPPFEGHGLPPWQVAARLQFYEETGIRPILWVLEKGSDAIFWAFLDVLERGSPKYVTPHTPRVIYPIEAFEQGSPLRVAGVVR